MQEYEVKRGLAKQTDLGKLLTDQFGASKKDGDWSTASFGAMPLIKARYTAKGTLEVDTQSRTDLAALIAKGDNTAMQTVLDTQKRWNDFLLIATGYDAKMRGKKAQAAAKKAR